MPKNNKQQKRNRKPKPRAMRVMQTSPVPDRLVVNMKYCESVLLSSTTSPATYFFALNDIFDPNYTGTGHQPLGHDQWAAFYDQFRVLSVDIGVKMLNDSSLPAVAGGVIKVNTTSSADYQTAFETPHSQMHLMSPLDVAPTSQRALRWRNVKPWTIVGLTAAEYRGEAGYAGATASSPSIRTPFLQLISQCADKLTAVDVRFVVEIDYTVELFSRLPLTVS
jgi:hypothetical protein